MVSECDMTNLRSRSFLAGQFIQANSALELATRALLKADRTSAVKACLAEAILRLAAEGEMDPIKLSEAALTRVRESCASCRGCDGLGGPLDRHRSLFQAHLSSHPVRTGRRPN